MMKSLGAMAWELWAGPVVTAVDVENVENAENVDEVEVDDGVDHDDAMTTTSSPWMLVGGAPVPRCEPFVSLAAERSPTMDSAGPALRKEEAVTEAQAAQPSPTGGKDKRRSNMAANSWRMAMKSQRLSASTSPSTTPTTTPAASHHEDMSAAWESTIEGGENKAKKRSERDKERRKAHAGAKKDMQRRACLARDTHAFTAAVDAVWEDEGNRWRGLKSRTAFRAATTPAAKAVVEAVGVSKSDRHQAVNLCEDVWTAMWDTERYGYAQTDDVCVFSCPAMNNDDVPVQCTADFLRLNGVGDPSYGFYIYGPFAARMWRGLSPV